MDIHFNDTRPAEAPAGMLFDVITDYHGYPDFNPALVHVRVIKKDDAGAEFVADRKTKTGKQVRAYDRYERHGASAAKAGTSGSLLPWQDRGGCPSGAGAGPAWDHTCHAYLTCA
jgi:hypothetical protein